MCKQAAIPAWVKELLGPWTLADTEHVLCELRRSTNAEKSTTDVSSVNDMSKGQAQEAVNRVIVHIALSNGGREQTNSFRRKVKILVSFLFYWWHFCDRMHLFINLFLIQHSAFAGHCRRSKKGAAEICPTASTAAGACALSCVAVHSSRCRNQCLCLCFQLIILFTL